MADQTQPSTSTNQADQNTSANKFWPKIDPDRIDTRLPFRTGWPVLPAWPVVSKSTDPKELFPDWQQTFIKILEILNNNHIDYNPSNVRVEYRYHSEEEPRNPTLVVAAKYKPHLPATGIEEYEGVEDRKNAVQEIRELFKQINVDKVGIEIVRIEAYKDRRQALPIRAEDMAILEQNGSYMSLVFDRNCPEWTTLDPLRWKYAGDDTEYNPFITITSTEAANPAWWDEVIPHWREKMPQLNFEVFHSTGSIY